MKPNFFKEIDMWGRASDDPDFGIIPSNDEYWVARKHPHFREETYWLEREAEFWHTLADSFYYGCENGDTEWIEMCITKYGSYFQEEDNLGVSFYKEYVDGES